MDFTVVVAVNCEIDELVWNKNDGKVGYKWKAGSVISYMVEIKMSCTTGLYIKI